MSKNAVVLLSGGLDSAVTAAIAKSEGFSLHALTFNYGQRHKVEIEASKKIASALGVEEHKIYDLDLSVFGGSALTSDMEVPKNRPLEERKKKSSRTFYEQEALDYESHADEQEADKNACLPRLKGIPTTYVPARNTIFLSIALAYAEVKCDRNIYIGANAVDYPGYPDCRPEYIEAFENMANLATSYAVGGPRIKINTPLLDLSKEEIIKKGDIMGVPLEETMSCYDPAEDGTHCGQCDSCLFRKRGFEKAGIGDPTSYLA